MTESGAGAGSWLLVEDGFLPSENMAREGLMTQGSGYLHCRASLEERMEGSPQDQDVLRVPGNVSVESFAATCAKWGSYVPGLYGHHPLLDREMVNLPYFWGFRLTVGGETFDPTQSAFENWQRQLDLRTGLLTRSFTWLPDGAGPIRVRFERFLSAAHKHLAVQRLTLEGQGEIVVEAFLEGNVRTSGFDHLRDVEGFVSGAEYGCRGRTDLGEGFEERCRLQPETGWKGVVDGRCVQMRKTLTLLAGEPVIIEKRAAVSTERDLDACSTLVVLDGVDELSYQALFDENAEVWRDRWERSDVVIKGDPDSQLALRVSIYHLLRSHVPDDPRVAIDAKGYAGDAYYGRFFWDTEMYLLPFFLTTDPEKGRDLMRFRLETLRGAKENAREFGCAGARYAWESDSTGRECCPKLNWQYREHEAHVTADVVYGLRHVAEAMDDPQWLENACADVLFETSRYWMDRIDVVDGQPQLLCVMGPDEYCPLTDNNAYTNWLVKRSLALAAGIGRKRSIAAEECDAWEAMSEALPIPRRADGLILQHESWERLANPQFEKFWSDRSKLFGAVVTQDRLYRSKASKQADVLMLMWLHASEFSREEIQRAWDVYEPFCTHDSSLSPGAHALMALRIGLEDRAWEFWEMTAGLDMDIAGGKAAQGIHIACSGAAWMIAVMGFGGLRSAMETRSCTLNPSLPAHWQALRFRFVWKGQAIRALLRHDALVLDNLSERSIEVRVQDETENIEPMQSKTFQIKEIE